MRGSSILSDHHCCMAKGGREMGAIVQGNGGGWFIDYAAGRDDYKAGGFLWPDSTQFADYTTGERLVARTDSSQKKADCKESSGLKKRNRVESCAEPGTKACREKMRRDRLNDRFSDLCSILDPGKPPRSDKSSILVDTTRRIKQLRLEARILMDSNRDLQESIKILKDEKIELRDEKARLKCEKERAERTLKGLSSTQGPSLLHPYPPPTAVGAYHPAMFPPACSKTSPSPAYPPVAMWQWLPPAVLDTSQDDVPPVA